MKKFILPTITFIAGLLIGYLTHSKTVGTTPNFKFAAKSIGTRELKSRITDLTKIRNMIGQFAALNAKGIIQGTDGTPLIGFHIDTTDLHAILKNPKCNGIDLYVAKNSNNLGTNDGPVLTMIFMGTTPIGSKTGSAIYHDNADSVYDQVDVCPKQCGDFK